MSFSAVGTIGSSTANSFTLTPHAVGDFILVGVLAGFTVGSTADYATSLTSSNVTWSVFVAHTAFSASAGEQTIFIGHVTSTSSATVTIGFNAGTPVCRTGWQEFSNTQGYSAVTLDVSATVDLASSGHYPAGTPTKGAGDLYWSYCWDTGTATSGSTSGYVYQADANGNGMAYNLSCANATQTPNTGNTDGLSGIAVLLYEAVTSFAGTAALTGSGSLGGTALALEPASGALTGSGSLGGTGLVTAQGTVALAGAGTLAGTGTGVQPGTGTGTLSGSGTLGGAFVLTFLQHAGLTGAGTLSGTFTGLDTEFAGLAGAGTLGLAGVHLGYVAGLSGMGTFIVTQVSGGQVNGIGGAATPQALPGASQVAVAPPDTRGNPAWSFACQGTPSASNYFICTIAQAATVLPGDTFNSPAVSGGPFTVTSVSAPAFGVVNVTYTPSAASAMSTGGTVTGYSAPAWQWLGTIGKVTALTYSYTCPGGCDQMTCTVMVPAAYRTQLFNPGWQVKVVRGGHDVWHGKLDEPVASASGWSLTAVGAGNLGTNFIAYYAATWPGNEPDEIIGQAIARGLPWVSPGFNSSPYASQFWFGQQVDPGAQTVTAFLNLLCTRGGLTWYVNSQPGGLYGGDDLQIFPLPAAASRLLVCTTPVARTLGGDINSIYIRYEVSADNTTTSAPAVYAVVLAQNAADVAVHGVIETYIDLSDVGVMTSAAAQAIGNAVLQIYQRASFAGPFTASYGQLLNNGGQPVDPGTDQAGTVVRLILTDFGYGGEVIPQFPITFIVGSYTWDDFAQVATITPYQNLDQSLTGMLSMENTTLTPITAASS